MLKEKFEVPTVCDTLGGNSVGTCTRIQTPTGKATCRRFRELRRDLICAPRRPSFACQIG